MATPEIEAFLTALAVDEHVSAATHNQALSALFFLYRKVLDLELLGGSGQCNLDSRARWRA